ncbi:hypothetical protein KHA96_04095 [Bacillus sp. FJAT-49711]|uniref:hypothetical protein n=1 Tax=Bacillus sp. FJAT-49711 TaxID=2833585 RepID=UPI001BCA5A06|nr:hypothetical protein [Bacillus sp. FJAT-49711]MBS4217492.1 hypothetical protein [Bacillus sp. FJAT-49711]
MNAEIESLMSSYTFEDLKSAINKEDLIRIVEVLGPLFILNQEGFRKSLIKTGCLPEPLSRNYDKKKLNLFIEAVKITKTNLEVLDTDLADDFEKVCNKLIVAIHIIAENNKKNMKSLTEIDFLDYPFTKQIQMLCTFIESQSIYSQDVVMKNYKEDYITGLEYEIPAENEQISIADNLEAMIDYTNTLIKLLHFKNRGKIDEQFSVYEQISPYYLPSIEKLLLLTSNRFALNRIWEKIKFGFWDLDVYDEEGKSLLYFKPQNIDNFKKERAATLRYRYKDHIYTNKSINKSKEIIKKVNSTSVNEDISLDDPTSIFLINEEVFDTYTDFVKIYVDVAYQMQKENLGSTIENIKIGPKKNITIKDILFGGEYLKVLALVYRDVSHTKFNDKDENTFKYLAPIFLISDLVEDFSKRYNFSNEKAQEILEQYIFYPNSSFDIFSQPLIYVGEGHIIFTPQLISQMNDNRIIEMHISKWEVDVSKKGTEYESTMRSLLRFAPFLSVNSKPITFTALDGKEVEFDFIGMFNDAILIVEIKCLKRPFSPKEISQREADVIEGVKQAKRREEIVKREWDKIKEQSDIKLPNDPPEKVIKIVCLNIFDFTGRIENDVYITDFSAFSKFFVDPNIKSHTNQENNPLNNVVVESLWKGTEPDIEDLLDYLKTPVAMKGFYKKLEEVPRPLVIFDEDDPRIAFMDFSLKENPISVNEISKKQPKQISNKTTNKPKKKKRHKKRNKRRH